MSGPCLCGDPYCPRCFPQPRPEPDPDEAYEIARQKEIDDAARDKADPRPAQEPAALPTKAEGGCP